MLCIKAPPAIAKIAAIICPTSLYLALISAKSSSTPVRKITNVLATISGNTIPDSWKIILLSSMIDTITGERRLDIIKDKYIPIPPSLEVSSV